MQRNRPISLLNNDIFRAKCFLVLVTLNRSKWCVAVLVCVCHAQCPPPLYHRVHEHFFSLRSWVAGACPTLCADNSLLSIQLGSITVWQGRSWMSRGWVWTRHLYVQSSTDCKAFLIDCWGSLQVQPRTAYDLHTYALECMVLLCWFCDRATACVYAWLRCSTTLCNMHTSYY